MSRKQLKGWLKHGDFILLDLLWMQISFLLAYWTVHGLSSPFSILSYQYQDMILIVSQLLVIIFGNGYEGILRRKRFDEALAVIRYMLEVLIIALLFLFLVHTTGTVSRLQYGLTLLFYTVLDYLSRSVNKKRILSDSRIRKKKSLVLVTSSRLVRTAWKKLHPEGIYIDYIVRGIILMDLESREDFSDLQVAVEPMNEQGIKRISRGWVDEVFIYQPADMVFPEQVMQDVMTMGIAVDFAAEAISNERWPVTDLRKLGTFKVITNSNRFASAGQLALKRLIDIVGGLIGTVITGILFVIIGPVIYKQSPGPIFFTQERIGRNGKKFRMYKFRSMYMDAEERKVALMAHNNVKDGMMFKMDDDPRIIGSEKKDKNGRPKGIGNFIRNTSLDEFPQFINVLIGQMSLVGTRPPTVDEWEKYSLAHRARMSFKPGITGMWQVSGRSQITDFDEVVRLDCEYIDSWNIMLDIKILLKTIVAVVKRKGAK